MKPTDELWNRWIDGELQPKEEALVSRYAKDHPEWAEEKDFFHRLSLDLRRTYPKEANPPYPEFFNNQIQKRLVEAGQKPSRIGRSAIRPIWWQSWWLPAAAAAVIFVVGLVPFLGEPHPAPTEMSEIIFTYTPDEGVHAETSYNEAALATVVRVTGIAPLPDDFRLTTTTVASVDPEVNEREGDTAVNSTPWGFRHVMTRFGEVNRAPAHAY